MRDLAADITIASPSFPENGRTVVHGHLFVGDRLLSESSMKDHPLTPMRDADISRVLQRQTALKVGRLPHSIVRQGEGAIRERLREATKEGIRILIADALYKEDLDHLAEASRDLVLLTGAAGIGDAAAHLLSRHLQSKRETARIEWPAGDTAILAGSCSVMTRRQLERVMALGYPALKIDPDALLAGCLTSTTACEWASAHRPSIPILYSSTDPEEVASFQARLGREHAGHVVEAFFSETARLLREAGFSRLMVAGGETSGAVVHGLGGRILEIGPEIDPGVPWTRLSGRYDVALALKSGNFGADDFFIKAPDLLS